MFGLGKPILYAVVALAIGTGIGLSIKLIRDDAEADILRQIQLNQALRDAGSVRERALREEEVNAASNDDLFGLACDSGLLPADACSDGAE